MDMDELRAKFPPDFPVDKLPDGAQEERIAVYRVCRSGKVEPVSFLPTYLDELSKTKENEDAEHEIDYYSLSTYEKEKEAKRILKFFRGKQPNAILALGYTDPSCGLCQRTKVRKKSGKSHVDWWLYQDTLPHTFFQEVQLDGGEKNEDPNPVLQSDS